MARSVRVLLFNADESCSAELRGMLTRIPGLKIVAELDEPSLLPQAVNQFPVDLVFVHLDPAVDFVLEVMRQLLETMPGLPAFALTEQTDGDVVLRAMRAGFREYLVKPLTDEELERALAKVDVGQVTTREPGKLIAVLGSAGGVGATMVAVNLASELSALVGEPKRVALVDLDFRYGSVAMMLDIQSQYSIADLCDTMEQVDQDMINKAASDHEVGVRVFARPATFQQADSITAAHCVSLLSALTEMCDYVIVDGPSRYDSGGQSVLDSADHVLLVTPLLVTGVRNTDRICRALGEQGFNLNRVHVVANRVDSDPGYLDVAQVEKTLGRTFFVTIPDDWKSVSAAINIGQPLSAQWSRSRARLAIAQLALKLHDPEKAAAGAPAGGSSLFSKILSGAWRGKSEDGDATEAAAKNADASVKTSPGKTAAAKPQPARI
jgi:pilus assembly protein CpaE